MELLLILTLIFISYLCLCEQLTAGLSFHNMLLIDVALHLLYYFDK